MLQDATTALIEPVVIKGRITELHQTKSSSKARFILPECIESRQFDLGE